MAPSSSDPTAGSSSAGEFRRPDRSERRGVGKAIEWVHSTAVDALADEHEVRVLKEKLGDVGVLGLHAVVEPLEASSHLVAQDPHRSVYRSEAGRLFAWVRVGGLVQAQLGLNLPITSGAFTASLGFHAAGALEYWTLHPYEFEAAAPLHLAKNLTIDLPFSARRALKMPRGAEVTLRGSGRVGATASAGVGTSTSVAPGITLSANASVGVSVLGFGSIVLTIKRLDLSRVFVRIGREAGASASFGVNAGVGVSFGDDAPAFELPGGSMLDYLEEKVDDKGKDLIEDFLQAEFRASVEHRHATTTISAFVLDLSDAESQAAYESLLLLDLGPAERLGAERRAEHVEYDESSSATARAVRLDAGGKKLFLARAARIRRRGELRNSDGVLSFHHEHFSRHRRGILSGKRDVTWEATAFQEADGRMETVFLLNYRNKDKRTTAEEVDTVLRFVDSVNAEFVSTPTLKERAGQLRRLFRGEYAETEQNAVLYFTEQGVRNIAKAETADVYKAYAEAVVDLARENRRYLPGFGVPARARLWNGLKRQYEKAVTFLGERVAERQYRDKFRRRSLEDDLELFAEAQLLDRILGSLAGEPAPEWAKAFADLGEAEGFDLWKHCAALNNLAGDDETLVHMLSIRGDQVEFSVEDEGRGRDVMAEIGLALSPPGPVMT